MSVRKGRRRQRLTFPDLNVLGSVKESGRERHIFLKDTSPTRNQKVTSATDFSFLFLCVFFRKKHRLLYTLI